MIGAAHRPARFRPDPPDPDALLRWPEAFGTRFCLTVDVEEEFDWNAPFDRDARNTTAMAALPDFHAMLAQRGVGAIYLADHPIAVDPRSIDILRACLEDGRSSIGAQLHPWVNPPHEERPSRLLSFPGNLAPDLERRKLRLLTDALTDAFGARPLTYRAGRYGLGPASIATLNELGYRIDSSMRARHDYSHEDGPDFRAIGPNAFRLAPGLIELPPSAIFTGALRATGRRWHHWGGMISKGHALLSRSGLLSRVPLSPEGVSANEAVEAIRIAAGDGIRLLNFSFHSPSLKPGCTPYVRDAKDLLVFHRWWDRVFDTLAERAITPASQAEILAAIG